MKHKRKKGANKHNIKKAKQKIIKPRNYNAVSRRGGDKELIGAKGLHYHAREKQSSA